MTAVAACTPLVGCPADPHIRGCLGNARGALRSLQGVLQGPLPS